jgi:chromosome segregation ATPase
MPHSNTNNNETNNDLAITLRATTALIKELVSEFRDNATAVAVMKEKIDSLSESVEILSHIVRDENGKGSMITRMALAEKTIEDLEESINELKKTLSEIKECIEEDREEEEKAVAEKLKAAEKALESLKTAETTALKKEQEYSRKKKIEKIKFWAAVLPGILSSVALLLKAFGVF